jgi:hypothetical protein
VDHLTVRNVLINRDGNAAPEAVVLLKERAEVGTLHISQVQGFGIEAAVAGREKAEVVRISDTFINSVGQK